MESAIADVSHDYASFSSAASCGSSEDMNSDTHQVFLVPISKNHVQDAFADCGEIYEGGGMIGQDNADMDLDNIILGQNFSKPYSATGKAAVREGRVDPRFFPQITGSPSSSALLETEASTVSQMTTPSKNEAIVCGSQAAMNAVTTKDLQDLDVDMLDVASVDKNSSSDDAHTPDHIYNSNGTHKEACNENTAPDSQKDSESITSASDKDIDMQPKHDDKSMKRSSRIKDRASEPCTPSDFADSPASKKSAHKKHFSNAFATSNVSSSPGVLNTRSPGKSPGKYPGKAKGIKASNKALALSIAAYVEETAQVSVVPRGEKITQASGTVEGGAPEAPFKRNSRAKRSCETCRAKKLKCRHQDEMTASVVAHDDPREDSVIVPATRETGTSSDTNSATVVSQSDGASTGEPLESSGGQSETESHTCENFEVSIPSFLDKSALAEEQPTGGDENSLAEGQPTAALESPVELRSTDEVESLLVMGQPADSDGVESSPADGHSLAELQPADDVESSSAEGQHADEIECSESKFAEGVNNSLLSGSEEPILGSKRLSKAAASRLQARDNSLFVNRERRSSGIEKVSKKKSFESIVPNPDSCMVVARGRRRTRDDKDSKTESTESMKPKPDRCPSLNRERRSTTDDSESKKNSTESIELKSGRGNPGRRDDNGRFIKKAKTEDGSVSNTTRNEDSTVVVSDAIRGSKSGKSSLEDSASQSYVRQRYRKNSSEMTTKIDVPESAKSVKVVGKVRGTSREKAASLEHDEIVPSSREAKIQTISVNTTVESEPVDEKTSDLQHNCKRRGGSSTITTVQNQPTDKGTTARRKVGRPKRNLSVKPTDKQVPCGSEEDSGESRKGKRNQNLEQMHEKGADKEQHDTAPQTESDKVEGENEGQHDNELRIESGTAKSANEGQHEETLQTEGETPIAVSDVNAVDHRHELIQSVSPNHQDVEMSDPLEVAESEPISGKKADDPVDSQEQHPTEVSHVDSRENLEQVHGSVHEVQESAPEDQASPTFQSPPVPSVRPPETPYEKDTKSSSVADTTMPPAAASNGEFNRQLFPCIRSPAKTAARKRVVPTKAQGPSSVARMATSRARCLLAKVGCSAGQKESEQESEEEESAEVKGTESSPEKKRVHWKPSPVFVECMTPEDKDVHAARSSHSSTSSAPVPSSRHTAQKPVQADEAEKEEFRNLSEKSLCVDVSETISKQLLCNEQSMCNEFPASVASVHHGKDQPSVASREGATKACIVGQVDTAASQDVGTTSKSVALCDAPLQACASTLPTPAANQSVEPDKAASNTASEELRTSSVDIAVSEGKGWASGGWVVGSGAGMSDSDKNTAMRKRYEILQASVKLPREEQMKLKRKEMQTAMYGSSKKPKFFK